MAGYTQSTENRPVCLKKIRGGTEYGKKKHLHFAGRLLLLGTVLTGCGEKAAGNDQKAESQEGTEPVTLTFLFGMR